jgi:hypothetical protein
MPKDDPVDTSSMIFTEEEVYNIIGYCAEQWGIEDDNQIVEDAERAIQWALSRQ